MGAEVGIMVMDEWQAVAMVAMMLESDSVVPPVLSNDDNNSNGLNAGRAAPFP